MQYRKFGKTDVMVSNLGFGMMRLPTLDGQADKVDQEKVTEMVHYAIENGVNYFDTAYPYHGGQSEVALGKALKGYRDKVYIATKNPVWMAEKREDYDKFLNIQLERLSTDHIDMYLMHGLNKERWAQMQDNDFSTFLDAAKADGRIKYTGFSFHDSVDVFKEVVDGYSWDFCLMQYNYLDEEYQAGTEGLKYANQKGMAVAIMEPLRGGRLAERGSKEVSDVFDASPTKWSPAEWGLRWVWNHPEVSVVLSGMGALSQVEENIKTAKAAYPNALTPEQLNTIEQVRDIYHNRLRVTCTSCNYCQPCPQGINIPGWFDAYNRACLFERFEDLTDNYESLKQRFGDLDDCIECALCEGQCPQNLSIRELLKDIKEIALGTK